MSTKFCEIPAEYMTPKYIRTVLADLDLDSIGNMRFTTLVYILRADAALIDKETMEDIFVRRYLFNGRIDRTLHAETLLALSKAAELLSKTPVLGAVIKGAIIDYYLIMWDSDPMSITTEVMADMKTETEIIEAETDNVAMPSAMLSAWLMEATLTLKSRQI